MAFNYPDLWAHTQELRRAVGRRNRMDDYKKAQVSLLFTLLNLIQAHLQRLSVTEQLPQIIASRLEPY